MNTNTPPTSAIAPASKHGTKNNALPVRDLAIKYGFLSLLAGLIIYFCIVTNGFASPQSAVFILQSVSITGILALDRKSVV